MTVNDESERRHVCAKLTLWKKMRRIPWSDWGWIHFKLALGVLIPFFGFMDPPGAVDEGVVNRMTFNSILVLIFIGALLSVIGVLLRGFCVCRELLSYAIELGGVVVIFTGPFLMTIVFVVSYIENATPSLISAAVTHALSVVLLVRFVDVYSHHLETREQKLRERREAWGR